eukprot:TRINITY_DN5969_c0_g4_i2.p1 TRINITY_DN5969_c0_g4~~TRINITY_DN5969_c0_g4_i2.p1  ORF type:complete len:233 (-),score=70.70 TRINITY_DN5969_c0_g4_i2:121-777(-)
MSPQKESKAVKKEEVAEKSLSSVFKAKMKKKTSNNGGRDVKVKKEEENSNNGSREVKVKKEEHKSNNGSRELKVKKEEHNSSSEDDEALTSLKKKISKKVEKEKKMMKKKKKTKKEEKEKVVSKSKSKVIGRSEEKEKKKVKKVYDLPGQKHDPPEQRDPLRIFYETLYQQLPHSEMTAFWKEKDKDRVGSRLQQDLTRSIEKEQITSVMTKPATAHV